MKNSLELAKQTEIFIIGQKLTENRIKNQVIGQKLTKNQPNLHFGHILVDIWATLWKIVKF